MDFPSVGHGQNDFFTFQARAFLDEIAGLDQLPRCPRLAEGLHNLRVLDAVVAASRGEGRTVAASRGEGQTVVAP
jgi:predicted dehydrogenase